MNRLLILSGLCLVLLTASCREEMVIGHGTESTVQQDVKGYYNRIEIEAPVDAKIEVAAVSAPSVTLSGFTNLLPYIKMEVKDSTLRIYVKEVVSLHTEKNLEARIILPSLAGISTSGSSDVNVTGNVTGPALEIDISGAGDAVLQSVNVSDLNIDLSGAASVTIQSGTVNKAEYEASGAGHIYAYGLQTTLTSVDFSGAGSAEVTASQTLDVEVSGAGSVSYKGHPSINKSISGVGSVTDAN